MNILSRPCPDCASHRHQARNPGCRGRLRRTRRKTWSTLKKKTVRLWHCRCCGRREEGS
jgi:hypothetical protein